MQRLENSQVSHLSLYDIHAFLLCLAIFLLCANMCVNKMYDPGT